MASGRSPDGPVHATVTGVLAVVTVAMLAAPAFGQSANWFWWGIGVLALTIYVGAKGDL